MRCANPDCGQELEPGSTFCSYCGTAQPSAKPEPTPGPAPRLRPVPPTAVPLEARDVAPRDEDLVMRAGERIWDFTESEGKIVPGRRRPILILDEEVTHLAHTDRQLTMEELFQRVKQVLDEYQVPVDVKLLPARWRSDEKEKRPRLVASMRDHTFADIKMIMGLDYVGRWASIQVYLGMEPEPLQTEKKYELPKDALYALIGGGIAFLLGTYVNALLAIGIPVLAFGAFRWYVTAKAFAAKRTAEVVMSKIKKEQERFARTYKIDDMRLFCTAMKAVFKRVVDDIVEQGAEVVRVEGGHGGFFSGSGMKQSAPTQRLSDAAALEV